MRKDKEFSDLYVTLLSPCESFVTCYMSLHERLGPATRVSRGTHMMGLLSCTYISAFIQTFPSHQDPKDRLKGTPLDLFGHFPNMAILNKSIFPTFYFNLVLLIGF